MIRQTQLSPERLSGALLSLAHLRLSATSTLGLPGYGIAFERELAVTGREVIAIGMLLNTIPMRPLLCLSSSIAASGGTNRTQQ
jgi:hypothetical protein